MENQASTGITPLISIENFSFFYPECETPALCDLTLSIESGAFLVVCGQSGSGKSTLLRQLSPQLAPHGHRQGNLLFQGQPIHDLDVRTQCQSIGFVQQSPDSQIVTDKVWHELAFGLESLGCDRATIRRRVAEMASFFGIEDWFHREVSTLSGGQKQLLNLAAVMVMQPQILLLDEPTSQLDPIAATAFLSALVKLNQELGTTIILTEHRLEEALPLASQVVVLEGGHLLSKGDIQTVANELKALGHHMFDALPTPMRIWSAVDDHTPCPITVMEGRNWLHQVAQSKPLQPLPPAPNHPKGDLVLTAQDCWFRYEKVSPDVVRGLSLALHQGELLALLGSNGAGKSTTLKLLAGLQSPQRGTVTAHRSVGLLPQNPQALFLKKTARSDLTAGLPHPVPTADVERVVALCQLESLLDRHPYDLSGGEQQRLALAKLLLTKPDILLLDEPTKGLDAHFKGILARILTQLLTQGTAILLVSHDVAFCAQYAHRCALFFDGNIVTEGAPRPFFSGNRFYTTPANRMGRDLCPHAILAEDWMALLGCPPPELPPLPPSKPLPPPADTPSAPPPKLPPWRKGLAIGLALIAVVLFALILRITDLSQLVAGGALTSLGGTSLILNMALLVVLVLFTLTLRRRGTPVPIQAQPTNRRTKLTAALSLALIPVILYVDVAVFDSKKYYFISLLILLTCMAPFFILFEGRKPKTRELVVIAVLCTLGVMGRALFFMSPQCKPVVALTIIAGVALGGETGFLVGALTMLASNALFGQSPMTPWQMCAMGLVGLLAGLLFHRGHRPATRGALAVFGALTSIFVYGAIVNPASALLWMEGFDGKLLLTYFVTGLPMDVMQGIATGLFLWYGGLPMLEKLERIKVKYGLL